MNWFESLFARKPGGTVLGNALRTVGSNMTNGLFGTGAGMITQKQADIRDMPDDFFALKYGTDKSGRTIAGITPNPNIQSQTQFWNSSGQSYAGAGTDRFLAFIQQNAIVLILAAFSIFGLPKIIKSMK